MIPHYRRKRNNGDGLTNNLDSPNVDRKDGTNLVSENLTRNPHIQVLFTADRTVVDGNLLNDSDGLHPVVKYGIPIGAMFILGLFLYATFSKRWNRKVAVTTDSVESMKLNSTGTIDSLAEYVNSQIISAESSVLDHVKRKIESNSAAIIKDMSVQSLATEQELLSGLKKAIAQQEMILLENTRKIFEQARLSITKDVRDEFSIVEETMEQLFKEHNQNGDERTNTVSNATVEIEKLSTDLSNIQKNITVIIRRRMSNSQNALLLLTEKQILHITDILNNIMPKDLQATDQDWNSTNSRIKDMEKSLIEEVRTTIVCTEENILEYIKNKINEVKQSAKIGSQLKPVEILQNDIKVDIKQPGKSSLDGTLDSVQNINEKKSSGTAPIKKPARRMNTNAGNDSIKETTIASETANGKSQLQEHNICSRCAAAKLLEETNKTVVIEIIEKDDIIIEMKQKNENVTNTSILEEKKGESEEELIHIHPSLVASPTEVHSTNVTIVEIHEKEIPIKPRTEQSERNYSVREQAENSIKLWLARFKQAVPHLPDNLHSSKKYDKSPRSFDETENHLSKEKDIQAEESTDLNNPIVTDVEKPNNLIEHQDYNHEESVSVNQEKEIQVDETHELKIFKSNTYNEGTKSEEETTIISNRSVGNMLAELNTTEVEIHQHPDESEQNVQEEKKISNPMLDTEEEISKESESNHVENLPLEQVPMLDDPKETEEKKVDESEIESITENPQQEAQKNVANYEWFKSEIEHQKEVIYDLKINDSTLASNAKMNTDSDRPRELESVVRSPRKWLNIDEIIDGGDESWPSHLPKIVLTSIEKENYGKEVIISKAANSDEETKMDVFVEHQNDEEQKMEVRSKEWLGKEETQVSSAVPHEEIIKICEGKILEKNDEELETNPEKREKVAGIPENRAELCSGYSTERIFPTSFTINENNRKELMGPQILAAEENFLPYKEDQKETNIDTLIENKEDERETEINVKEQQEIGETLDVKSDNRQSEDVTSFNTKEWLDINTDIQDEKEKLFFQHNDFRKESIASTSSGVSISSNELTLNEMSRKEEERDILQVLKLPNMDNKLRKKRRINRRQLKSLDSGVHHYYGEYIAIEFPVNDLDGEVDQKEDFNEKKQSIEFEVDQKLSHLPSTSKQHENYNSEDLNHRVDIDLTKTKDGRQVNLENVAFQQQGQSDA